MIKVDLHSHTSHSHARDSAADMVGAARAAGLSILGFSEHSPRPEGYDYPVEYRERLEAGFPDYIREVSALRDAREQSGFRVLLGLEVDWLDGQETWLRALIKTHPYDYLIGGLHFLGRWGFDFSAADWTNRGDEDHFARYEAYYRSLAALARSGLFHIAAHPDLIKIFSVCSFRAWLARGGLDMVREALAAVKDNGMALEVSSAGLRKPCAEIYPGPAIMRLAADLKVPITFASDAHSTDQIAWKFPELARYAASFGYRRSLVFSRGEVISMDFIS